MSLLDHIHTNDTCECGVLVSYEPLPSEEELELMNEYAEETNLG